MRTVLRFSCCLALGVAGCSDPLQLGTDLLWTADQETGNLEQWTHGNSGGTRLPSADSTIEVSSEAAHSGNYSVKLVNPTGWNPNDREPDDSSKIVDDGDEGPELFHAVGNLEDAYYSAWFLLPEEYQVDPALTLLRLRARAKPEDPPDGGEDLVLRSLKTGGYVLQVFSNNSGFLFEPVADPAPHVASGRWFQLEVRYEPRSAGRLRVWLDGALVYDLGDRLGAPTGEGTLSVSNVAEHAEPQPLVLFVDDAAISSSRVSPQGSLH